MMARTPRRARARSAVPPVRALAFSAAVAALLALILFPILPGRLTIERGNIASQTIRAPREVGYNSEVLRQQIARQREDSVRDVVSYDVTVQNQQLVRLNDIVARITVQRNTAGLTRAVRDGGIASIQGINLSGLQRSAILDLAPDEWTKTADEATRVLRAVLEEPFSATDVDDRRAAVRNRVAEGVPPVQADLVVALVQPLVVPTQRKDETETAKARERARSSVEPQPVTYARNQVIVREGDAIDDARLEALAQAGMLNVHLSLDDLAAVLLICALGAGALGLYLHVFQPPSLGTMRRLLGVALLIGALELAAKLYLPLVVPDTGRRFLAFVLPVAVAPMLVAALFEAPFALAVAVVCTMLTTFTALYLPDVSGVVGLSPAQPLQMAAAYLFGGLAGVLVVHRAERLNRFLLAGMAVAAASFLGLLAFWFLESTRKPIDLAWMGGASLIAGLLSAVLTVGLFALLGSLFGITTRLQLMELAQFNAPLLRLMQDEAPGTFHHSILVGNLAERAADLIGADSLLARVGAYYHDIGKMGRPAFFVENQLSGDNPHDGLDPLTSTHILQEHVRHGLELARRYHLPERVQACIREHHGTLRTAYFYRKAAQTDPDIDPALFSYPGPRPGSRETALVMLADSTEASVRAAKDRSGDRVDQIVDGVIAERLAEGQFDDCDLTLRDLRVIAESFKHSLRAIYHPRIEYPEPTAAEQERRRAATVQAVTGARSTPERATVTVAPVETAPEQIATPITPVAHPQENGSARADGHEPATALDGAPVLDGTVDESDAVAPERDGAATPGGIADAAQSGVPVPGSDSEETAVPAARATR